MEKKLFGCKPQKAADYKIRLDGLDFTKFRPFPILPPPSYLYFLIPTY